MIATLATRVCQILFTAIVLGISIHAIQWQRWGSAPATTSFCAFAGAFGLLTSLIGLAAIFISAIPGLIMAGIDALASIMLLAGGIAFAIGLSGIDCGDTDVYDRTTGYGLVNGGCHKVDGKVLCAYRPGKPLANRCHAVQADTAFLFLGFIASVVGAVLAFIAHRRGGTARSSAV